jgi:flagellar hook assembly protein FlgD
MASYTDYTTDRVLGSSPSNYNAVFTTDGDNSTMSQSDFLKLLVAQMQNQNFTDPMDDTTMITQMAQFANMQEMQKMSNYMQAGYAMGLVGKTATASRYAVNGQQETATGVIDRVVLNNNDYIFYIKGKGYKLSELSSIQTSTSTGSSSDTSENQSTLDTGSYALTVPQTNGNSALLKWPVPTEDSTKASTLKYTLYYSTKENMNTVAEVEANGAIAGLPKQAGMTQMEATGLLPNTKYYFNVVVEEANGTKTVYKPVSTTTTSA